MFGEGSVDVQPDTAYVTLAIEARDVSLLDAQRDAGRVMSVVVERLQSLGIRADDIQSLPSASWRDEGEPGMFVVSNVTASNRVRVRVRDLSSVGMLLEAAAEVGVTGVQGISYVVEDRREFEARAREEAVRSAAAKAAELARLSGLTLGLPVSISEVSGAGREGIPFTPDPPFDVPHMIGPYDGPEQSSWTSVRVVLRVVYSLG